MGFSTGPHAKYTHWKYVIPYFISLGTGIEFCQRQTVFYTPSTITISQGEKIRGRLSCAPNTKNNRDLDITISYETDGTEIIADYKMCVVFPVFAATSPRLVNTADRWSGVDCIFIFILLHWLVETYRVACTCLLFDDIWWFGGGSIQVLSDMHTNTSLEYHVVGVVRRNATVSGSVVSAGAVTEWLSRGFCSGKLPDLGTFRQHVGSVPRRVPWLRTGSTVV